MADKLQKLIQNLKRVDKNSSIHADDDAGGFTKQVKSTFPVIGKLAKELLISGNDLNDKNAGILKTAGFPCSKGTITCSKGTIQF